MANKVNKIQIKYIQGIHEYCFMHGIQSRWNEDYTEVVIYFPVRWDMPEIFEFMHDFQTWSDCKADEVMK